MAGMAMIHFALLNIIARIVQMYTDYWSKKMPWMAMIFFCPNEYNRTDLTDLHGLFVENASADGGDGDD